jgi:hypothetical protein
MKEAQIKDITDLLSLALLSNQSIHAWSVDETMKMGDILQGEYLE